MISLIIAVTAYPGITNSLVRSLGSRCCWGGRLGEGKYSHSESDSHRTKSTDWWGRPGIMESREMRILSPIRWWCSLLHLPLQRRLPRRSRTTVSERLQWHTQVHLSSCISHVVVSAPVRLLASCLGRNCIACRLDRQGLRVS